MNINFLPKELLQKIFIDVGGNTKLELVCRRWNENCKTKYVVINRPKCICFKGYEKIKLCKSKYHFCICNLGLREAMFCKSKNHICVCLKGINFNMVCNSKNHPCLCSLGPPYDKNCRANKHVSRFNFFKKYYIEM